MQLVELVTCTVLFSTLLVSALLLKRPVHSTYRIYMAPTDEQWPPRAGLSTHVVPRKFVIVSVPGSITIEAPARLVFQVIRDVSAYPSWNSFCPSVTIHSQPDGIPSGEQSLLHKDTAFTFGVVMDPAKPNSKTDTSLRITDLSTPSSQSSYLPEEQLNDGSFEPDLSKVWRIAWTTFGGYVARGLKTERFSEVIELDDGRCLHRTWECQGGILARTVKWMFEKRLKERFQVWCQDLKRECERQVKEGKKDVRG